MLKITSEEFQKDTRLYQDIAFKEPVMITNNGREQLVLINAEEYKQLRKRARIVMNVGDLSDDEIQVIKSTEMSEEKTDHSSE